MYNSGELFTAKGRCYSGSALRHWMLCLAVALMIAPVCPAATPVVVVAVDGVVHPVTVEILDHALQQASEVNAAAILVRLDTPGGLMEAMRDVNSRLIASPVPVITYVTPSGARAASAGFFILQAGDIAAMAPGTHTGAASPVAMGGEMDQTMRKKVESDAAASLRALTGRRGRNSELAQAAVLEARSFTEQEALKNNLIDLVAGSERELLDQLDGREITRFDGSRATLQLKGAPIIEYEKRLRERILSAIANPNVALILLVLGALGVYIEFSSPGLIVPGVAGSLMALLGLAALSIFPINWLGAALMIVAVVMFILEAQIASHGILGIGGTVAMVLGAMLLIDSPVPEVRIQLGVALAIAIPFALITIFLVSLVLKASANKVVTGRDGLVGAVGRTVTELSPEGKVFVHGEYWDAISSTPVPVGAHVRIVSVEGLRLAVEADQTKNQSGG
jgi:membrane-bound serine protease (ClpP class)